MLLGILLSLNSALLLFGFGALLPMVIAPKKGEAQS
jgi:hypothetical protein